MLPDRQPTKEEFTLIPDEAEYWLLRIVDAASGELDASDSSRNPLNAFCNDRGEGRPDTFNRCIASRWLRIFHDADLDASRAEITEAGRTAISRRNGRIAAEQAGERTATEIQDKPAYYAQGAAEERRKIVAALRSAEWRARVVNEAVAKGAGVSFSKAWADAIEAGQHHKEPKA